MEELNEQQLIEYLAERLHAAESYIKESPCDPDITKKQTEAYVEWYDLKEKYPQLTVRGIRLD